MTTLSFLVRRPAMPHVANPLAARLVGFLDGLRRWRQAAATRRSLQGLDDAGLRDLGLSRAEIASIAAEVHGVIDAQRVRSRACREVSAKS
jgi:uncharacterized protein YjiS (DUF1127 family)